MTRSNPDTPAPEAIIITISTTNRLVAKGAEEVPTGVPAKNHGAVVATDPHQTAAAAVMAGRQTATETASTPRTLIWRILMSRRRVVATAAAVHRATVAANRTAAMTNTNWYHPNPTLRCRSGRPCAQMAKPPITAPVAACPLSPHHPLRLIAGHPPVRRNCTKRGRRATAATATARAQAPAKD